MSTGTIKKVWPKSNDNGDQRHFTSKQGKTFYVFNAIIEDERGGEYKGEVNGTTAGSYRFKEGEKVKYEYSEDQYGGKFKIERIDEGGPYAGKKGGGSAWTPEKEMDVRLQGFIKNAVGLGLNDAAQIEASVREQLKAHKSLMAAWKASQPAPAAPAPPPPAQAPVNASVKYAAALNDDDDLPF